jgi:hypothetical protein
MEAIIQNKTAPHIIAVNGISKHKAANHVRYFLASLFIALTIAIGVVTSAVYLIEIWLN